MGDNHATWADLFRESVIFQGMLAMICLVGTFALLFWGHFIPDYIWVIDASVIGYFFGARGLLSSRNNAQEANRLAATMANQNSQIIQTLARLGVGGVVGAAINHDYAHSKFGFEHDDHPGEFEKPISE